MILAFKLTIDGVREYIFHEDVVPTNFITQTMQLKTVSLITDKAEKNNKEWFVDTSFLENEDPDQFVFTIYWGVRGKKESRMILIPVNKTYRLEIQTFEGE